MSLFSDERVEFIAEKILQELIKRKLVKAETRPMTFKSEIKKAYVKFYRLNEEIELAVKKQLSTMSKGKTEGSQTQKVLYEKLFLEEWKKH
ncbi:MAG: hypothetical protein OHK0040_11220 [bacterium]